MADVLEIEMTDQLEGVIKAPSSKSITQRAISISSMDGESTINNPLDSDDIRNAIKTWRSMGADIEKKYKSLNIDGFKGVPDPEKEINVGESGTILRFILPAISLSEKKVRVTGENTLYDRSNKTVAEALTRLGVEVQGRGKNYKIPLEIKSEGDSGDKVEVSGEESSQVFSGLLIALPHSKSDTEIIVEDKMVSKHYIDMTIEMLEKSGIEIEKIMGKEDYKGFKVPGNQESNGLGNFDVPGDYSSSAFLLAAGALVDSDIRIENLEKNGIQGDEKIIEIIERMGGNIDQGKDYVEIKGPFDLEGIEINGKDTPDIVPVISVLAAFAKGKTNISNIGHLKVKESNRLKAIEKEFSKLGIKVERTEDCLTINGSDSKPKGGFTLSPWEDHRIAMSLSLIGLKTGDLKIKNPGCINKSYPKFLDHMKSLDANMKRKNY